MKEEFEITIEQPKIDFKNHLSLKDNKRIIFSGPFGTGKTYFLKKFFQEFESKYECIFLSPVDYSVASNEDIFELVKYDIFCELILNEKLQIDLPQFSNKLFLQFFLASQAYNAASFFAEKTTKVGKAVIPVLKALEPLIEKITQKKKEYEAADFTTIKKYLKGLEKTKGSIKENDVITEIIWSQIVNLKNLEGGKKKESILVIDDLDRIDPEHIFRLLNVFAAHFDPRLSEENKFGFDKVIFVCDIENIRNIYHSKYGANVDFSGYIDKFFSVEEFNFDNRFAIQKEVRNVLQSIKMSEEDRVYLNLGNVNEHHQSLVKLGYIISEFILSGGLNVRKLRKLRGSEYQIDSRLVRFRDVDGTFRSPSFTAILEMDFLRRLCGSMNDLKRAIECFGKRNPIHLSAFSNFQELYRVKLFTDLLLIRSRTFHRFGHNSALTFDFTLYEYATGYKCTLSKNSMNEVYEIALAPLPSAQIMTPPKLYHFHNFWLEVIQDLESEHIIR